METTNPPSKTPQTQMLPGFLQSPAYVNNPEQLQKCIGTVHNEIRRQEAKADNAAERLRVLGLQTPRMRNRFLVSFPHSPDDFDNVRHEERSYKDSVAKAKSDKSVAESHLMYLREIVLPTAQSKYEAACAVINKAHVARQSLDEHMKKLGLEAKTKKAQEKQEKQRGAEKQQQEAEQKQMEDDKMLDAWREAEEQGVEPLTQWVDAKDDPDAE